MIVKTLARLLIMVTVLPIVGFALAMRWSLEVLTETMTPRDAWDAACVEWRWYVARCRGMV